MKKQVKRAIVGLSLVAGLGLVAGCGSDTNVGYVDMGKVVQQSNKAHEIDQKMQSRIQALQEKMAKMQESGASEQELMKAQAQAQQELSVAGQASQKEFMNYIEGEAPAVAKEQGVSVILMKQSVLSGGKDVTEAFIKHINGNKPAAQGDAKKDSKDNKDSKADANKGAAGDQKQESK